MKEHLLIVSELFYPDETSTAYILTEIAIKLCAKYDVEVICNKGIYNADKATNCSKRKILPTNMVIHRNLLGGKMKKNNVFSRIIRLSLITVGLLILICRKIHKGSKVLIVTNPAPLMLAVSGLKMFLHFKLYILVHDVFPENAVAAQIISKNNILYRVLRSVFSNAYSKADHIIVLGRDMKDVLVLKLQDKKHQPTIEIIENWAEEDIVVSHQQHDNHIVLQYAGNMGRVQSIETFITCFQKSKNQKLNFEIWGGGRNADRIHRYVDLNNLQNISFFGKFSRKTQNEVLGRCHIALISLVEGMYGLGVPSKAYNIMAAGRPILYIGDLNSEIALTIREYDTGYCFESADSPALLAFLRKLIPSHNILEELRLKGVNARILAETKFSHQTILTQYSDTI